MLLPLITFKQHRKTHCGPQSSLICLVRKLVNKENCSCFLGINAGDQMLLIVPRKKKHEVEITHGTGESRDEVKTWWKCFRHVYRTCSYIITHKLIQILHVFYCQAVAIRLNQTAIQAVTPITSFEKRQEGSPNPDRSDMLFSQKFKMHLPSLSHFGLSLFKEWSFYHYVLVINSRFLNLSVSEDWAHICTLLDTAFVSHVSTDCEENPNVILVLVIRDKTLNTSSVLQCLLKFQNQYKDHRLYI